MYESTRQIVSVEMDRGVVVITYEGGKEMHIDRRALADDDQTALARVRRYARAQREAARIETDTSADAESQQVEAERAAGLREVGRLMRDPATGKTYVVSNQGKREVEVTAVRSLGTVTR